MSTIHQIRQRLSTLAVIDTHDHTNKPGPRYTDPVQVVLGGYFYQDLAKLSSLEQVEQLKDPTIPLEQRWPLLQRLWSSARFTGFGRVSARVMRHFYGENALTLDALQRMREKMPDLSNPMVFDRLLGDANIVTRLISPIGSEYRETVPEILGGTCQLSPRARLTIRLTPYHNIASFNDVVENVAPLTRDVRSLDDYLDACRTIFAGFAQAGAVAFKDISAYTRALDYADPDRAAADALFASLLADPRRSLGYPHETRPLNDYLFHQFLDMARDLNLPMQLHTGSLGGFGKDIRQANAAHLTRAIQLHPDVRFDLFHANWPYGGEVLFLAKNYSNVAVNLCWTHVYDATYSRRFLQQALSLIPHVKIHGYGSDYVGYADRAWAHLHIALDNISYSLAQLVDADWFSLDDAMEVAECLLFRNPNHFYRLSL